MTSATPEDADAAADAAARAFPVWAGRSGVERGAVLGDTARRIRLARDDIAPLITAEMGKPIAEARSELDGVAATFEFFGQAAAELPQPEERLSDGLRRMVSDRPVGPVLVLNTWNFPVETVATPLAPALAAGCTAVVLANPVAPSSVVALFRLLAECDLPRGAVNLLAGSGPSLSKQLIADKNICHVAYTGSVSVGRTLAAQAGQAIKRATLELGGNAPAIILPGAEVEATARALAGKRYWNAGQVCTAPNRIYVHESIYEAVVEAVTAYCGSLKTGPGDDPSTTMGPLATTTRRDAMRQILEDARTRRTRIAFSGEMPDGPGNFFPPTVLADMPEEALGMTEEIFGPIACLSAYRDVDSAVERANACDLGLSAYVFGPDRDEAERVARRLKAGSVGVNQMVTAFVDTPFGGVKDSGLGVVGGRQAIREFQKPRLDAIGLYT